MKLEISWLAIDWGTTNFRAFAMNDNGESVDKIERELGLLQIQNQQFDTQLKTLLKDWLVDFEHLPLFLGGMVGSKRGWVDAGYATAPLLLSKLSHKGVQFAASWGALITIIPGVSYQNEHQQYDVMRGEEVQLMGALDTTQSANFLAVLPGTHSKHVLIENGELQHFSTFMTGELYSLLSKQSILGRGFNCNANNQVSDAFYRGVREGQTEQITHRLFLTRTHRLFGNIDHDEVLDYLSGLLIGNELKALLPVYQQFKVNQSMPICIIGGEKISQRYILACDELGIENKFIDGDECFISGMSTFRRGSKSCL